MAATQCSPDIHHFQQAQYGSYHHSSLCRSYAAGSRIRFEDTFSKAAYTGVGLESGTQSPLCTVKVQLFHKTAAKDYHDLCRWCMTQVLLRKIRITQRFSNCHKNRHVFRTQPLITPLTATLQMVAFRLSGLTIPKTSSAFRSVNLINSSTFPE